MSSLSPLIHLHVLLADDDKDDCLLFNDVLEELPVSVDLTAVHNGEQLMQVLDEKKDRLPDILFLDLNMPRKNGFQCLSEIKQNEGLKNLPVIIFSTSFDLDIVNQLYQQGAQHCIRKPSEFSKLKEVIQQALILTIPTLPGNRTGNITQPPREDFILSKQIRINNGNHKLYFFFLQECYRVIGCAAVGAR